MHVTGMIKASHVAKIQFEQNNIHVLFPKRLAVFKQIDKWINAFSTNLHLIAMVDV